MVYILFPTLCNPITVHRILQATILEWVDFSFSRGSSQPRDQTQVSHIAGGFLPAEPQGKPKNTGVGSLSLLQQIFLSQESNQGLLHCRWIFNQLNYEGSPHMTEARLQQYMNREISDVQTGFRKGRGTRDHIADIRWIVEKAREFQKNICFCFIDYTKAFDCVDHNKLWKTLQEMGITDHLTCLLRNMYAGQEVTVRKGYGAMGWLQIGKRVHKGCILSPCLFNFMQST